MMTNYFFTEIKGAIAEYPATPHHSCFTQTAFFEERVGIQKSLFLFHCHFLQNKVGDPNFFFIFGVSTL